MSQRLSLKKLASNIKKQIINHPQLGKINMHNASLDKNPALKKFYDNNYYPGYILGNLKLFNWMFKHNKCKVSVLSLPNKKIIAHQGLVPIIFSNGKDDYKGIISASTIVDSNYRRKGLMTHLRGTVQRHYQTAVSLGGSAKGIAIYTAMDYKHLGDLTRLIAIINLRNSKGVTKNLSKLKSTIKLSKFKNPKLKPITKFLFIQDELSNLWRDVFPPKTYFGVKRDYEFLDWRYTYHPIFKYYKFGLWDKDKLEAVIVYRIEKVKSAKTQVIRITDLFGYSKAIKEIVKSTVFQENIAKKAGWIDFYSSNQHLVNILKSVGFKTKHQLKPTIIPTHLQPVDFSKVSYPFMFWSKDKNLIKKLPPFKDWYVTTGDGDADRPNTIGNYTKATTNN